MTKVLMLAALLWLPLPMNPALAGPGGCADCSDEKVCSDCQEFYAEIAKKVPEKGARVWGWVLGGLTSIAFIAVFIHVVRGDRQQGPLRRRRVKASGE